MVRGAEFSRATIGSDEGLKVEGGERRGCGGGSGVGNGLLLLVMLLLVKLWSKRA